MNVICPIPQSVKLTGGYAQLADITVTKRIENIAPEGVKNPEQAYSIKVTPTAAEIIGYGKAGLTYGELTFSQLAEGDKIPCVEILDFPLLKTRGHFMECRYGSNLMTLDDWRVVVDDMASKKQNQLVVGLYGCWCVQYDGKISEYLYVPIKKYPELQTPVYKKYFSPAKGAYINEKVLPPMFEQDFFGELVAYGASKGVEVLPLFNSYGHNTLIPRLHPEVSARDENGNVTGHGYCVSNADTYELIFDIYDEIIQRYLAPNGITSFHIGMDEVRDEIGTNMDNPREIISPWCKCPECALLTNEQKFYRHAVKLISHLKERGMKSVYIYQDMLLRMGTPEGFMAAMREAELLDVVVVDWWTYSEFVEKQMFTTIRPELGLRSTVKPWNGYYHWVMLTSPLRNIKHLAEIAAKEGAEGMQSYSAWNLSYDRNHSAQADYAWNFYGAGDVSDVTDRYVKRNFADYLKARHAFKLIDIMTEDTCKEYTDGSKPLSKNSLLLTKLSYYWYSYPNADKDYPRNFPGEAVGFVLDNREDCERALCGVSAMAEKALKLLPKESRFYYEVKNYQCLVNDYLALIEIHDCRDARLGSELAAKRAQARLELMELFEGSMEDYLAASHMRNHSLFMQYFKDLAAYLAKNDKFDLRDMRFIASDEFKALR